MWAIRGRTPAKIAPWEWVVIGAGIAGVQLLTQGGFEPFTLLAFILAARFESAFRDLRYSNWLSPACGLLIALGIQSWIINFKVVKHDLMAPVIRQDARVFYQPAFFRIQPGDRVLFKSVQAGRTRLVVGQIRRVVGRNSYEIVRLADNQPVWLNRQDIKGKITHIVNPQK